MINDNEFWLFLQKAIRKDGVAVFCDVVSSVGSSPGKVGFMMGVTLAGEIRGTIGGGVMEFNMIKVAQKLAKQKRRRSELVLQKHKKNVQHSSGLLCSGTQIISMNRLDSRDLPVIKKIITAVKNHEDGLLRLTEDSFEYNTPTEEVTELRKFSQKGQKWEYRELYGQPDTIYVLGGGHVGLSVCKIMNSLGYYVVVFDPRLTAPTVLNNVYADEIIICDYEACAGFIKEGLKSYAVVVTSNRVSDLGALKSILHLKFRYLGAMGSISKIATIIKGLKEAGFTPEQIKKIHGPVGLEIAAETPDEIAISIAAELIKVRNSPVTN